MGIFNFFSTKAVDSLAKELVADLVRRYPPSSKDIAGKKMSAKGISNILESLYKKAIDFKRSQGLGIYKTARLGNTFRWELKEQGYDEKFIEVATEGLVVYLTRGVMSDDLKS